MAEVTYKVVEHNGGWAYRVGEVFSETFATREAAAQAAEQAASRHGQPGGDEPILYQDEDGTWREEAASGGARPETEVKG